MLFTFYLKILTVFKGNLKDFSNRNNVIMQQLKLILNGITNCKCL